MSMIFNPMTEFILCICLSLVVIVEYGKIYYRVLKKGLELKDECGKLALIGAVGVFGNIAFLLTSEFGGIYFYIAAAMCTIGAVAVIAALWRIFITSR